LQLTGHSGNSFDVTEGLVHGQLLVEVLATVAVGLHESNSNEVITFMLTSGNQPGRHNGYGSPIHGLNALVQMKKNL
jgi:Cu2+-containing amine oxidase